MPELTHSEFGKYSYYCNGGSTTGGITYELVGGDTNYLSFADLKLSLFSSTAGDIGGPYTHTLKAYLTHFPTAEATFDFTVQVEQECIITSFTPNAGPFLLETY